STQVLRESRCVECFYWCIYYDSMAAQKVDANKQRIYTDLADAEKKLAWYSAWPDARTHLLAAREAYAIMDQDIVDRHLTQTDAFRQNLMSEVFYLLTRALPRRAKDAAELQSIADETAAQWRWYQQYFTAPLYPAGGSFHSPAEAAAWYEREQTPNVADWNNYHPDDPKIFHEQLPR
ncbi:MAG TPA: hypothetical protein VL860_00255, partial [Planctomycetota bacterium]|nr:hypothetical protein [Planctomycetota bacterium]